MSLQNYHCVTNIYIDLVSLLKYINWPSKHQVNTKENMKNILLQRTLRYHLGLAAIPSLCWKKKDERIVTWKGDCRHL